MEFHIIIPARYAAQRLPGKPLVDIAGKPMLQHVYERAVKSGAESVVIATDDQRTADVAQSFGATVCLTSADHQSGTERLIEVVQALEYDEDDIVLNVQGDEPMVSPAVIRQVAQDLTDHDNVKVASVCEPFDSVEEFFNPNVVKVVLTRRNYAMYFSRSPIPWQPAMRDNNYKAIDLENHCYRHIGIYGYRAGFLLDYVDWPGSPYESLESLEQLRVLWNGGRIYMSHAKEKFARGIDTPEDLERIRALFKGNKEK